MTHTIAAALVTATIAISGPAAARASAGACNAATG
jgi:hypothetical protein